MSSLKAMGFSKFRWICTVIGLIFSIVDVISDLLLSSQYFSEGHYVWFALTLLFMLIGSLCAQTFSYSWFRDDCNGEWDTNRTCKRLLHVSQLGFFTRYYDLLKRSFNCVWKAHSRPHNDMGLFMLAADVGMLKLMETFLESVPQLLLQTYIMLQYERTSKTQYLSMVVSFLNVAWCTVDYWRCLRRTLPNTSEMPGGIPTVTYLLYKILLITARILSLSFFLMLTPWNILMIAFNWLVAFVWANVVKTDFCTSPCLEQLYRIVIGVILVFTFFNIKGKKTKKEMTIYYMLSTLQNLCGPILLYLFSPGTAESDFFFPVTIFILMSNGMGLGFLILYYSAFHPQNQEVPDVVDGMNANNNPATSRMDRFLKP